MESLLEQILDSPQLPYYWKEINSFWQKEQTLREQCYATLPDKSHEFVNGKVINKMPNTSEHNKVQNLLSRLLSVYIDKHQLGRVGAEKMMISLLRNDFEPDICFWNKAIADNFDSKQMLFPAPDFIVEVLSKSTKTRDRGIKFTDYATHGVAEYWLIDPEKQTIEQHKRYQGEFRLFFTFKDTQGMIESFVIDGFKISVKAIFDENANFEALHGIISPKPPKETE
jgi:Uma2 family endonuclease